MNVNRRVGSEEGRAKKKGMNHEEDIVERMKASAKVRRKDGYRTNMEGRLKIEKEMWKPKKGNITHIQLV